ncbi:glutathione S-transferase family protein [Bradyrhizobium sp. U87765 SZCCT0131]|uniref:glutathione S-transferase family protein n=1 Tax=unclassified Bradyrhizobium TaxID=2631580 RepID=UPI001BAB3554|nr:MULTISPECIES: glutathione S-transferase family protein [unclassified Bradyrhizobium]MBR1220352.1 glutathione S-transferase family protein [Bradyrhizobium sp. U87765 SZCCT0131]MBR1263193.1 glutathione S-transferase family protein [Bradyrhizobium sp. U87765 SZCCT0134]MBR1306924.1 glutathione S-transferase family protein [Bradyrhizobium sp. U87765 SZCCT0110]MBR1323423.1 glutathione S-transferase family protein [Bradyrhizobium sp. U87765 SZCCT0109]MBR1345878.1 glutathione S-transferase family p
MPAALKLISHKLCPYVQRVAIALAEKGVPFERVDIDLANKPDWFLAISPLGKTPVLQVGDTAIFESAVILEYLEETQPQPLHPADPLARAEHRGWIEFNSAALGDIWGLETAKDEATFRAKVTALEQKFARLETRLVAQPWFDGAAFSLVDAVFAPAFRYFDVIDGIGDFGIFTGKPKLNRWRASLAERPSVQQAVSSAYPDLLRNFMTTHQAFVLSLEGRAAA